MFDNLVMFTKLHTHLSPLASVSQSLLHGLQVLNLNPASDAIASLAVSSDYVGSVHSIDLVLVVGAVLELVKRLEGTDVSAHDPGIEPPRKNSEGLVAHVGASGNSEDVVEFFEGTLLGFRDP